MAIRWWSLADDSSFTLLGWFRGERTVLVEFAADALSRSPGLPEATELQELRPLAPMLPADSASLLAYARALVLWRARHRFCGVCGAAEPAGSRRPRHALQPRAAATKLSRASIRPSSCW